MTREELLKLAERLTNDEVSNALDVAVEVALFTPDEEYASVRANAAGTKVIYTETDGIEFTYWAPEWCRRRRDVAISDLRARASIIGEG